VNFSNFIFSLLANLMLLIAAVFIDTSLQSLYGRTRRLTLEIARGLLFGIVCVMCMRLPFIVAPGIQVDARQTIACFAAIAGPIPGLIVLAIAVAYRFRIGGDGLLPGLVAMALSALFGMLARMVWRKELGGFRLAQLFQLGLILAAPNLACTLLLPKAAIASYFTAGLAPNVVSCVLDTIVLGYLFTYQRRRDEAEDRYRSVFSTARDAIFLLDPSTGKIRDANPAALSMYGYSLEEFRTMNIGEVSEEPETSMRSVRESGSEFFQRRHRRKNGSSFPVEISASAFLEGQTETLMEIVRDASELRTAEVELRRKEAQLSHAIKMARLGSWDYDVERDLFTFTDDFYAIFRTSAEEVGGYSMSSAEYARRFVHRDDAHLVAAETKKAVESKDPDYSNQIEHRMVYADGSTGVIAVRIFMERDEDGRAVRTYGVNQDISESKRAEEKLRGSLAEKETLLRELYHRTKNNMNVIIALLNMQSNLSADEGLRKALAEAQDRIYSMALIHQSLYDSGDLSQIGLKAYFHEFGSHLLSSHAVSPGLVDFEYDMEDISVAIDTAIPCGLILNELLSNALKHAFPAGRKGVVAIALRRGEGNAIILEVADDGVGLVGDAGIEMRMRMGLKIVKSLAENQLKDGRVTFSAGPGLKCELRFVDEPGVAKTSDGASG